MRPLTQQHLLQILPNARPVAGVFVPALNRAMTRFRVDSAVRRAAFLAQVGHESGQLRRLVENLNYSAAGLAATLARPVSRGRRRAKRPGPPLGASARADRQPRLRQPPGQRFFRERGWLAVPGRGLIQLTGRANYRACGAAIGVDLVSHPELLEQPECAALSAAWFWTSNGLNELADAGRFEDITRRINGGTHGQPQRLALWRAEQEVLA